jgi:hypothetical protein
MFHHQIELCDPHYNLLKGRTRNYNICFDDKEFKAGQTLRVREFKWDTSHNIKSFTGEHFEREIINVLKKAPGLQCAFVIVSLK